MIRLQLWGLFADSPLIHQFSFLLVSLYNIQFIHICCATQIQNTFIY